MTYKGPVFQYIAAKQNISDLEILINYTIEKYYPNIKSSKYKALDLLNVLIETQTQLVIDWMRVGFILGVMNTDNMSISGETIDYGPCAFMDVYDEGLSIFFSGYMLPEGSNYIAQAYAGHQFGHFYNAW